MNAQEARQIVFKNLRDSGCPESIAKRVFDVPSSMIETAEALLKARKRSQMRGAVGMDLRTESMLTGKCFEQILEERSPGAWDALIKRQHVEEYRNHLAVVGRRSVGAYVDGVHRKLAVEIANVIAIDNEYEARWNKIRENLRCAGAQGTER